MKKLIIILLMFAGIVSINAQTYTATIAIDNVDVSKLKPGDEIMVPVRLIEKSGGKISELQFFIEFDHEAFKWNGSFEQAHTGIKKCHPNMPWDPKVWMLNDNGNQLVVLWSDPEFKGVEVKNGELFCELVFIYKGISVAEKDYLFKWGDKYEDIDGKLVRGVTEMYSEIPDFFTLTMVNGKLKLK